MILCAGTDVNKNNYYEIENDGHKFKSSQPVRPYSISSMFVQQKCQNIAKISTFHMFTQSMDGLFHKMTEWCIKYGAIKTTEKLRQSSK